MDFFVELGTEMGEKVRIVDARGVAGEIDFINAKAFSGAENGTDVVSRADII